MIASTGAMTPQKSAHIFHSRNGDHLDRCIARFPDIQKASVRKQYRDRYRDALRESGDGKFSTNFFKEVYHLNHWVAGLLQRVKKFSFQLAKDEEELKALAQGRSEQFRRMAAEYKVDPGKRLDAQPVGGLDMAYILMAGKCEALGVEPPELDRFTPSSAVLRMVDPRWWRKRLRKEHGRAMEEFSRAAFNTHKKATPYVGGDTFKRRRQQINENMVMMANTIIRNELGEELSMLDVAKSSNANPFVRFSEMVVRMKAFDEIAERDSHPGFFFTITAPSKYHPARYIKEADKCVINKKFLGHTARDARTYLTTVFARIRAKMGRSGIRVYGFRVAEPHHDGTPHFHILLFFEDMKRADKAIRIMREHACAEDREELVKDGKFNPGPRFHYEYIDRQKGSAVGYLIKYISKNMTGENLDTPDVMGRTGDYEAGTSGERGAQLVEAWASTHGIRQWQQLGGAPVTVWRMLRKMTEQQIEECKDEAIKQAAIAAHSSDYATYTDIQGGVFAMRKEQPITLLKVEGEVGSYGDELTVTMGIQSGTAFVFTKVHQWEVVDPRDEIAPWTCINNCTGVDDAEIPIPEVPAHMLEAPPPDSYQIPA